MQSDTTIYFSGRPASLRTFSRRNVLTAGVGWLGGSREGGGVWGQAWADAGFVVVHVQQPGSDADAVRTAQRTGLGRVSRKELASAGQLLARFQDVVVVLDQIARQKARNEKWANVRADGAGVAGHSFGAYTVLGLGGQTHSGHSGHAGIEEPRVAALVALSPTLPVMGEPVWAYAKVKCPTLWLTGMLDADVLGNGATAEKRAAVFDTLPASRKAVLLLKDADHFTFSGSAQRVGSQRLDLQREATATHASSAGCQNHYRLAACTVARRPIGRNAFNGTSRTRPFGCVAAGMIV